MWMYCWLKGSAEPLVRWVHDGESYLCPPEEFEKRLSTSGLYSVEALELICCDPVAQYFAMCIVPPVEIEIDSKD